MIRLLVSGSGRVGLRLNHIDIHLNWLFYIGATVKISPPRALNNLTCMSRVTDLTIAFVFSVKIPEQVCPELDLGVGLLDSLLNGHAV